MCFLSFLFLIGWEFSLIPYKAKMNKAAIEEPGNLTFKLIPGGSSYAREIMLPKLSGIESRNQLKFR